MKVGILTTLLFLSSLSKPALVLIDSALIWSLPSLNIGRFIVTDRERRQALRCLAVLTLLVFLNLYFAVPFCLLFTFLTLALLGWLYPFQVVDNLLGRMLARTVSAFDQKKWIDSHKERTKIYPVYLLGVSLIILLPFQHYRHISEILHIQSPLPIISPIIERIIETNQTFEFWELAVCLWSLLFLLIFFLRELHGHAETLEHKSRDVVFPGCGRVRNSSNLRLVGRLSSALRTTR